MIETIVIVALVVAYVVVTERDSTRSFDDGYALAIEHAIAELKREKDARGYVLLCLLQREHMNDRHRRRR